MKNIEEYKIASDWFLDARKAGYSLPGIMCAQLSLAQKETGLSFKEVYDLFIENEVIIKEGYFYIYNEQGRFKIKNYEELKKN